MPLYRYDASLHTCISHIYRWIPKDENSRVVQDVEGKSIARFTAISKAAYCAMVIVIQMVANESRMGQSQSWAAGTTIHNPSH